MIFDSPDFPGVLLLFAEAGIGAIEGWFRIAGGRIVARGSGIDALPPVADGERLILVLQGPEVAVDWLDLPALTDAQAIAAARLKLVDRSIADIGTLHVALGPVHGERRMAATIEADLLERWIRWAAAQGLDPDHIVPLPLLIAYGDGPARYWLRHGLAHVRGHDRIFSAEADLAALVLGDEPTEPMDDARFEAELAAALLTAPLDLRQGRFVRRREWRIDAGWRRRMTRYAIAALILLALVPVARLGRIAFDTWRFESEARRVARLALGRESLPGDPRTALQQRLSDLRGPGMGLSAGAGVLFGAVAHTPNVELSGLNFDRSGTIVADVTSANPADLAQLVQRIGQAGLVVETMPGAARGNSVLRLRQP